MFALRLNFFPKCVCPCIWDTDVHNWEFLLVDFSFDECIMSVLICFEVLGWKSILLDIRMATLACFLGSFAWKKFSSLLLWGSFFLCQWCVFAVYSKMLGPVYVSSLLVYVLLLWNWVHWCWKIIRTNDCFFLLVSLLVLEFYYPLCG